MSATNRVAPNVVLVQVPIRPEIGDFKVLTMAMEKWPTLKLFEFSSDGCLNCFMFPTYGADGSPMAMRCMVLFADYPENPFLYGCSASYCGETWRLENGKFVFFSAGGRAYVDASGMPPQRHAVGNCALEPA